jgi:hypothetical protein
MNLSNGPYLKQYECATASNQMPKRRGISALVIAPLVAHLP